MALDTLKTPAEEDWALLSPMEREHARRFRGLADRVRAVATRAALRRLLAVRLDTEPDALNFTENRYGKPSLSDAGRLEFNVSHAGEFALIALSSSAAVGIDIERRVVNIDEQALIPHLLSPLESRAEGRQPEFFERWVAKEAALKALGVGISEHLQAISILGKANDHRGRYRLRHECHAWPELDVRPLEAPEGYAAALAVVRNHESRCFSGDGKTRGMQ